MTDKHPQDEIITEVRSHRHEFAARFDFNVDRLYEEVKRLEQESDRELLEATPKRVQPMS